MTEGRSTRRRLAPVVTTVLISGVITAAGVLLYVFTNQTVASYAVGVAGLVAGAVGTFVTARRPDEPRVKSELRASDVTSSDVTGIDADSDPPMSSRMELGRVIRSNVTGIRIRRRGD
jgi:hypothetical protein